MAKKKATQSDDGKPAKSNRNGVPLHVWIEPALRNAIDTLAAKNRRPLTTEVVIALERYLTSEGLWPPAN